MSVFKTCVLISKTTLTTIKYTQVNISFTPTVIPSPCISVVFGSLVKHSNTVQARQRQNIVRDSPLGNVKFKGGFRNGESFRFPKPYVIERHCGLGLPLKSFM